jgi:hypothetical protein
VLPLVTGLALPAHADDTIYFPAVHNVTAILVDRINRETVRIDMSAWYLTERAVSLALVNRFKAGVRVRLLGDRAALFENDELTKREFYWLASQGVPIRLRYHPTWYPDINHWKATIFAGQNLVSFGSANYTPFELAPWSASNYKDETVMFTTDPSIVNGFKTKFDRFWNDTTAEPGGHVAAPPYFKNFDDACALESACADYHVLFPSRQPMAINLARLEPDYPMPADIVWSQGPEFNARLVQEIDRETTGVNLVVYRLTAASIVSALERKLQQGVPVRLIVEPEQYMNRDWPEYWLTHMFIDRLWAAGASVRQRAHTGLTHMKMLVTSHVATNASSNFAEFWQRDHNYFVRATTKPAIYGAMQQRFVAMWFDDVGFAPFVPQPPDRASLASPGQGASVGTRPTLTWHRAAFASAYDVSLGTSPSALTVVASVPAQLVNDPPDTYSWTPSHDLQPGTQYYWAVVAKTHAATAQASTGSFTTAGAAITPTVPSASPFPVQVTSATGGVAPLARVTGGDFDRNGRGDLVAQVTSGGVTIGLNMAGQFQIRNLFDSGTIWSVAGFGNFDGVGSNDVVWQHPGGAVVVWALDATGARQASYLYAGTSTWRVVAVADMNRDGYSDLIWQSPIGQVVVWIMLGTTVSATHIVWESSSEFRLVAAGDFNGDGHADIVWQHPTGKVVMWLMQGLTRLSSPVVFDGATPWQIVAASDLDANGKSDLVWRGPVNYLTVWSMNGASRAGSMFITLSPWQVMPGS